MGDRRPTTAFNGMRKLFITIMDRCIDGWWNVKPEDFQTTSRIPTKWLETYTFKWNQKQQGKKSTHKTGRHLWTDSFLVMFPIHPPTHEKPRSRKINTYHSFYNRVGEYDQFRYVFLFIRWHLWYNSFIAIVLPIWQHTDPNPRYSQTNIIQSFIEENGRVWSVHMTPLARLVRSHHIGTQKTGIGK